MLVVVEVVKGFIIETTFHNQLHTYSKKSGTYFSIRSVKIRRQFLFHLINNNCYRLSHTHHLNIEKYVAIIHVIHQKMNVINHFQFLKIRKTLMVGFIFIFQNFLCVPKLCKSRSRE